MVMKKDSLISSFIYKIVEWMSNAVSLRISPHNPVQLHFCSHGHCWSRIFLFFYDVCIIIYQYVENAM